MGAEVAVFDAQGKQVVSATTGADGKALLEIPENKTGKAQHYTVKVKAAGAADWSDVTCPITVKAEFPFSDVKTTQWYFADVEYMWENGLMVGMSSSSFAPSSTVTRGMLVTILGRAAGVDVTAYTGNSGFTDVSEKAYYAAYVKWAAEKGIVKGTDEKTFNPGGNATREQIALILARYAAYLEVRLPETETAKNFKDTKGLIKESQTAIDQLSRAGIIQGKSSTAFDPKGKATRAEVAALVHRFIETTE